jgi:hypothetical protein
MAVTVPKQFWQQFFRIQKESAFGAGGGTVDWNIGGNGGGATGWRDVPVIPGSIRINPVETQIFTQYAAGKRAMNQQPPVPGAYEVTGSFETPLYIELIDPFIEGVLGSVSRVETAGSAALASTAFASVATLDTQSNGTEQFKFVISSSTAASGAAFNIIQSGATVETITIGTSASSVDGTYYSKGAYDGTTNAITFSVDGTVTAGTVVVSGVDYVTTTFTLGTTNPSYKIEEGGQPRSGTNSGFYTGTVFPTLQWAYDRTALEGLVTVTAALASQFVADTTAGTFANDPANYYHPVGGWTASLLRGGAAYEKVQSADYTIGGMTALFPISSGNQDASGATYGASEMTGTLTILPEDATEWGYYVGQTVSDIHLTYTSPESIVDSTKWSVLFEWTKLYLETYTEGAGADGLINATLGFRTIEDSSDGIVKVTTVSRMPV